MIGIQSQLGHIRSHVVRPLHFPSQLAVIDHCTCTVDVGWTRETFHYNKTFGAPPSADESTEEAWDALVPRKVSPLPYDKMLSNLWRRGTRIRSISREFSQNLRSFRCASAPLLGMSTTAQHS